MKMFSRLLVSAKKSCPVVFVIAALLFPMNAFGMFIDVVSQQYSISGEGYCLNPVSNYVSYNETGNNPLSRSDTGYNSDPYALGGEYSVSTSASGGWTTQDAWLRTIVNTSDEGNAVSWGSASAAMTFRPLVTSMIVNPFYSEPGVNLIRLTDVTANQTLLEIDSWGYNQPYLFSVDPSHLYNMIVGTGQINLAALDMYMTIRSVPEPSTMLLLGTGLLGLAF